MRQENDGDLESEGVEKTKKKKTSDAGATVTASAVDEGWYLPGEVVIEILVRLPVFAVLKCTAVCKEWNTLIGTSEFVRRHRFHSLSASAAAPSLIWRHYSPPSDDFTLHPDPGDFENFPTITSPFVPRNPRTEFYVFGSVHGLICFCDNSCPWLEWAIFIWNPMVSRYLELPSPACISWKRCVGVVLGFGHDSRSDDYKLVRVTFFENDGERLAEVYSLKERRWREVVDPSGLLQSCSTYLLGEPSQCFVEGAVHWVVQEIDHVLENEINHNFILAFSVGDESVSRMELPEQFRVTQGIPVSLNETKVWGSLTLFYHCPEHWEVWVKKEYSVDSSWAKYLSVCLANVPRDSQGWMVGLWQGRGLLGARPSIMPASEQDHDMKPWEKMRLVPAGCQDKEILFVNLGVQDYFQYYAADYQESLVLREPGMGSASYGDGEIQTGIRSMNLRYRGPRPEWWEELF